MRTTSKNKEPPRQSSPIMFQSSHPCPSEQKDLIHQREFSLSSLPISGASIKQQGFLFPWLGDLDVPADGRALTLRTLHCGLLLFTFWLESHRRGALSLCSSLPGAGGPSVTLWPDLWSSRSRGVCQVFPLEAVSCFCHYCLFFEDVPWDSSNSHSFFTPLSPLVLALFHVPCGWDICQGDNFLTPACILHFKIDISTRKHFIFTLSFDMHSDAWLPILFSELQFTCNYLLGIHIRFSQWTPLGQPVSSNTFPHLWAPDPIVIPRS